MTSLWARFHVSSHEQPAEPECISLTGLVLAAPSWVCVLPVVHQSGIVQIYCHAWMHWGVCSVCERTIWIFLCVKPPFFHLQRCFAGRPHYISLWNDWAGRGAVKGFPSPFWSLISQEPTGIIFQSFRMTCGYSSIRYTCMNLILCTIFFSSEG